MNRTWLLEHADVPINYYFNKESNSVERLMQNSEVSSWFSRLFERSSCNNIGDIHGSHDYRMENILGKCWILGLSKSIDVFSDAVAFILEFLNNHLQIVPPKELVF